MTDTNISRVEQTRINLDIIDEDWEKDYLSDDDLIIPVHGFEVPGRRGTDDPHQNGDDEDDEDDCEANPGAGGSMHRDIAEETWRDAGADRWMLELLTGDSNSNASLFASGANSNSLSFALSGTAAIRNVNPAPPSAPTVLFLPQHVPNH